MKEKFNFKKFLKENKDKWIYLDHYNDTLKLYNEGVLYVKNFECINGRLAKIEGTFIQRITFDDGTCSIMDNEKDTNFMLAKISVEAFNKTEISEELAKETIERMLP